MMVPLKGFCFCGSSMQAQVLASPIPDHSLLRSYRDAGAFADCYFIDVDESIDMANFVAAFYTTRLFKVERLILKWTLAKPSTDDQARQVAEGDRDDFAAWTVERRADGQLLMCDLSNRTRSWFMVASIPGGTRLHFGSAVVPIRHPKSGQAAMGGLFKALLGFHKIYSRLLLKSAQRNLRSRAS